MIKSIVVQQTLEVRASGAYSKKAKSNSSPITSFTFIDYI